MEKKHKRAKTETRKKALQRAFSIVSSPDRAALFKEIFICWQIVCFLSSFFILLLCFVVDNDVCFVLLVSLNYV